MLFLAYFCCHHCNTVQTAATLLFLCVILDFLFADCELAAWFGAGTMMTPPAGPLPWTCSQKLTECAVTQSWQQSESRLQVWNLRLVCQWFCSCECDVQSHLSFGLLMDPVSKLDHLCVDTGTVQPRASFTPAYNPCQEPPLASLQTHQRAARVTLKVQDMHVKATTKKCANLLPDIFALLAELK